MAIRTDSWHYRWYMYWLAHGRGVVPGYQENLCHYIRVLLFWAPGTWIDQHSYWDWEKLSKRVALSVLGLYILSGVALLVATSAVTQTTRFLMATGSLIGLLTCIGMMIATVRTVRTRQIGIPGTVKLGARYVVAKKRRICPFLTFEEPGSIR